MITIVREQVKMGRNADHSKFEAGWPAAMEKAKSPDFYLGMTSLTGENEAWFVIPWESYATVGESMKREDKDPVLSAELARLSLGDAEYVSSARTIQARARTELSVGEFPDVGKARFFQVTVWRVRRRPRRMERPGCVRRQKKDSGCTRSFQECLHRPT